MVVPGTGPVVVVGRISVVLGILNVVKLVLPWQSSQPWVPTGMWFSVEGAVGEAPQDVKGIGLGT
jgi:hypothetical protein